MIVISITSSVNVHTFLTSQRIAFVKLEATTLAQPQFSKSVVAGLSEHGKRQKPGGGGRWHQL